MDADEFRKWGKKMVDYVADYWETLPTRRPYPDVKPGYMNKIIPAEAPEDAEPFEAIFADLEPAVMQGVSKISRIFIGNCFQNLLKVNNDCR